MCQLLHSGPWKPLSLSYLWSDRWIRVKKTTFGRCSETKIFKPFYFSLKNFGTFTTIRLIINEFEKNSNDDISSDVQPQIFIYHVKNANTPCFNRDCHRQFERLSKSLRLFLVSVTSWKFKYFTSWNLTSGSYSRINVYIEIIWNILSDLHFLRIKLKLVV